MGIFIPGKRSQNRRFSYEPRYYDSSKDESVRRRLRIMSRSRRKSRSPVAAILLVGLLVLAIYIYSQL